jgi:hypothetical protein
MKSLLRIGFILVLVLIWSNPFGNDLRVTSLMLSSKSSTLRLQPAPAWRQPASDPVLFFSDLESGPNSGGEGGLGVFITLWGEGFGLTRGGSTVTIGGQEVAHYVVWGQNNALARDLDMIVVQPGPDVASGNIVVTANGKASNPLPFTVRPGNIYFVATTGNDEGNDGSFAQPWRTVAHAKNTIAAGDTVYIMDGVTETAEDTYGAVLSIETSGAQGAPKALVAYHAAIATIGSDGLEFGIRVPNIGIVADDWVIAKLVLRGQVEAVEIGGDGSSHWRVVGNDISCPVGDGQTGCFTAALASDIDFLGNEVHGVSRQGSQPSKQYHAVYFTTDTNHVEVGWNHIHDNDTCRAIQFHSSPLCVPECGPSDTTGFNQYDLSVHDNLIHGDVCDGINFATVDPSHGPVRAFNNIIYDVGRGPSPPDGDANYAGIFVAGGTNTGPDGTGDVEIFNNTLYDCGARGESDAGAFGRGPGSPGLFMHLQNNIIHAVGDEDYVAPSSNIALITGTHSLWFGAGGGPTFLTDNVNADPLFLGLAFRDFRLQADSPAVDAGINTGIDRDFTGVSRPQGLAFDIGAFEFETGPAPLQPWVYLPFVLR